MHFKWKEDNKKETNLFLHLHFFLNGNNLGNRIVCWSEIHFHDCGRYFFLDYAFAFTRSTCNKPEKMPHIRKKCSIFGWVHFMDHVVLQLSIFILPLPQFLWCSLCQTDLLLQLSLSLKSVFGFFWGCARVSFFKMWKKSGPISSLDLKSWFSKQEEFDCSYP